jgi:fructose-bisphosphate aldolase class II
MLTNTKRMFEAALDNSFAVGAYNFANMEVLQGIIDGARRTNAPVIVQVVPIAVKYATLPFIVKMVEAAVQDFNLPIALHLDHGDSFEVCKECIDAGFTSVMFDGSALPYEENINMTKKICDYAHSRKSYISVEAELGQIAGTEGDGAENAGRIDNVTDVHQAVEFVERSACDSLAIACGTKHGAYKSSKDSVAAIRQDVLAEFQKFMPRFPIVVHGSSAVPAQHTDLINACGGNIRSAVGLPDESMTRAVAYTVCKVNIDTDLRLAATGAIRKVFRDAPAEFEPMTYFGAARDAVSLMVQHKTKVLNSADKARLLNLANSDRGNSNSSTPASTEAANNQSGHRPG